MADLLTPAMRTFLEEVRFGVLATINKDGSPQLTVMWYKLQGDEVRCNTALGRQKSHNITRDPRLALTVEEGYRYISLYGTGELIDDPATAQADIRHLAIRYRGDVEGQRMYEEVFQTQQRVSIVMHIERVDASGFEH